MPKNFYTFTSESVSMGHPDKMADQISDAILDAMLTVDPTSRVACETLVTTGLAVIAGEVTCGGYVDIPKVVRDTVLRIGYDSADKGFDGRSCGVLVTLGRQSPDIARGVNVKNTGLQGHQHLVGPLEHVFHLPARQGRRGVEHIVVCALGWFTKFFRVHVPIANRLGRWRAQRQPQTRGVLDVRVAQHDGVSA